MKTVKIKYSKYPLKFDYYVNDNGSIYSAISFLSGFYGNNIKIHCLLCQSTLTELKQK